MQTFAIQFTVMTKVVNDLQEQMKNTEDVHVEREQKTYVIQIKRDQHVEENRRTDLATVEENQRKDLVTAEERKVSGRRSAEAAQDQMNTVLAAFLIVQAAYDKRQHATGLRPE